MAEEFIHPNIPKNRYLYVIRRLNDTVKVEKHPIIYENKSCVYFKRPGVSFLDQIIPEYIFNTASEAITHLSKFSYNSGYRPVAYCREDPGHNFDDRLKLQTMLMRREAIATRLDSLETKLVAAEYDFEKAKRLQEELKSEISKLNKELKVIEESEKGTT